MSLTLVRSCARSLFSAFTIFELRVLRGVMAALVLLTCVAARAQTAHNLGSTVTVASGFNQPTGVAVDGAGNVYVADRGNNVVKEIPYSGGSYGTPVTLGSGFVSPRGVAVDGAGNVYVADTGNSAVKEIPHSGGSYGTPVTLGSGFSGPYGVAVDGAGNVYVADTNNSAVKEIPYSGGSYGTPVTLSGAFFAPFGVAVDATGNVYVADAGNDAVDEIPYSGGSYGTPVTLGSGFESPYGVAVDGAGNVYVADTANRNVFVADPSKSNAVEEIPYSGGSYGTPVTLGSGFENPYGVAVDATGNVYVSDAADGSVKEIELAVNFGTVSVGASAPNQTVGFYIDSAATLGTPAVLTQGAPGLDFTMGSGGSVSTCSGQLTARTTCTVTVNFSPLAAGARKGAVELVSSTGAVLATAYLKGIGTGPQVAFPSNNTISTLGSGFKGPAYVAVDAAGNVYVGDNSNNAVKKIPYSGGTPVTLGSGFNQPFGVAVDGAGNVYVSDTGNHAVKEIPYSGGSYGTPVTLGSGFSSPFGVAVDGAGNVYVSDIGTNAVTEIPYISGSHRAPVTLGSGFNQPFGVAVDGAGNVYVADYGTNAVEEIPYLGDSYGAPVTLVSGFNFPFGVAVDGAGNVYVADYGNNAVKEIPYLGDSYGAPVTLGSGFSGPFGVAVDGAGNVYVADYGNNAVKKIDLADAPTVAFATPTADGTTDTTDGTQTVTVQNIGNQPLLFAIPASGTNPSSPADFTFNPVGGSACPQLTSSAFTEATLAPGATCTLPLTFTPVSPSSGALSESLTLTDDDLNKGNSKVSFIPTATATQSIGLTGTATPAPTVIASLSPASGPAAGGNIVIITGTNIGGQVPLGGVGFQYFFGTAQASTAGYSSSTSVPVLVPAGTPGSTVPVTVVGPGGTSNAVFYTYHDALSVANSSLVASPSPAVAGSSITLTATVVDATGNPVSGVSVQFSAGASKTATLSNGGGSITGSNGVATVTLTDTAAETLNLSATVSGTVSGTLTGSASFVAPAYVVSVLTDETSGNGVATNCLATGLAGDNSNCGLRDAVAAANALTGVTARISFAPALTASATTANPETILIAQSTPITISQNVNLNGPGANLLTIEGGTTPLSSGNFQILQITGGNVVVSGVTLANGFASTNGGAIFASGGTLSINYSTLSGNSSGSATGAGGAISSAVPLTIAGSTFMNNAENRGDGGAIYALSTLNVANSTFYLNSASSHGGAISGNAATTVASSTFFKNSANTPYAGAAIYSGSALTVTNSIFDYEQASSVLSVGGGSFSNIVLANRDSIQCTGSGCGVSNQITADPLLGNDAGLSQPGYFGGTTPTFLPHPGSSAICAGTPFPYATDQRGVTISPARYGQSACYDIGAVQTEYALSFSQQPTSVTVVGLKLSTVFIAQLTENGSNSIQSSTTFTDADGALTGGSVRGFTSGSEGSNNVVFDLVETGDTLIATVPLNSAVPVSLVATSAPFNITPDPIGINPNSMANSTLIVSPSPAVAGSPVTLTATLIDAHNYAINGASATFTSSSTTASFGTPVVTGNVITVTMTDTMAETAPITATFGGNATGVLTGSAQFVAPAYTVVSTSDPATGNGTASNCVDINLPSYSAATNQSCELRDAVAAANALTGVTANIGFAPALTASATTANPATILIAQSTPITMTASMNITGPGANLLTIEGGTTPLSSSNQQVFQQTGGTVTLSGMTVANGYNVVHGGGLYQTGGTLTVSNSTFSGNQASAGNAGGTGGGAIYATTTLTVSNSTFSGNQETDGSGGAIYAGGNSTLTVSNSTFSGNEASGHAGVNGGAIYAGANSTLTVSNSTFSGNSANALGGAIYLFSFSTLTVTNSIFSNDTSEFGSGVYATHGGTVTKIVYNGDSFQGVTPTSSVSADPKLSALGSYGGPTQTMLPLPGSAAICAGTQPAGATDQRGFPSSFTYNGNTCYDIGAVQTEYSLALQQAPSSVTLNSPVSQVAALVSEIGGSIPVGAASVTLTDTDNDLSAAVSGINANGFYSPVPVFLGPQFVNAEASDSLVETLVLNPSLATPLALTATSASFPVLGAPISTANSTLTVNPGSAVAGSTVTVTATLLGAGNFAINGASATFTSSSTTASFGTPVVTGNVITVTMTDTMAETAPITATFGGNATGVLTGSASFVAPAYTVVSTSDPATGNGTASNCVDINLPSYSAAANQSCELRDAVAAANALTGVTANIGFAPALTASATTANPATILIAQSTPITITQSINLNGPGANLLTIEGGIAPYNGTTQTANYQILQITGGNVAISGVTLANGSNSNNGGAISANGSGNLSISNMTFSGNESTTNAASGGALYCNLSAPLTVTSSFFSGNQSSGYGGAIFTEAGCPLTITSSTFSVNQATVFGGAVLTLGQMTVAQSTFSGNSATGLIDARHGGGLFGGTGSGGGIYAYAALTVSNSTFSDNQASTSGAAIFMYNDSNLSITDSIFSGDTAANGSGISASGGTVTNNVIYGEASSGGVSPANSINANPNLAPLGYYGGTTQTLLPLPGSAAICAGTPSGSATDQRGFPNSTIYGSTTCYDIGAVQTNYNLSMVQGLPGLVYPGVAISPPPSVQVSERGGGILPAGTVNVSMADSDNDVSAGGSASNTFGGSQPNVSFPNLQLGQPEATDHLIATLVLNGSLAKPLALTTTSTQFQVGQPTPVLTFVPNPASQVYGTPIAPGTLNASAASAGVTVKGSFTYTATPLAAGATVALTPGVTVLPAGQYTLTASFQPANPTAYAPVSTTAGYTVNLAAQSTLTVTAPSSLNYGATGTLGTSGGSGTGAVTFSAGASTGCSVSGSTVTAGSSGGTCTITATKAADNNYTAATANLSITLVAPAASISLGVSSGTQTYPTWTNFEIAPAIVNGKIPTGKVSLYDNGALVATIALNYGVGYYTASPFNAGINNLTVVYSGDSNYKGGTSAPTTLTVLPAAVNFQASCWGATVWTVAYQCTVNLSSDTSTPPTGTISYSLDGANPVTVAINSGNAPFTVPTLPAAGSHKLTIAYAGQGNYAAGKTITESFATQPGQTELQVYPSSYYIASGSSLTISGTATTPSSGIPTGSVTFYDNGTVLGTSAIGSNGAVSYTIAKIAKGSHSFHAVYTATQNYAGATSGSSSMTAY